jgi:hypothetical protein
MVKVCILRGKSFSNNKSLTSPYSQMRKANPDGHVNICRKAFHTMQYPFTIKSLTNKGCWREIPQLVKE